MKILKCDYDFCDNDAQYYDPMDNVVCEDCMHREVDSGEYDYEDYESIDRD